MKKHLDVARFLTKILDRQFSFLGYRFGLDPILGVIPGLGDILPLIVGSYMVWIGTRMKMPADKITQMIRNLIIDFVIGVVPVVGDISDFFYRAHAKNLAILEEFAEPDVIEGELVE